MNEQPEALRLADELDGIPLADMTEALADDAAAELRRLHEVNQELLAALRDMLAGWIYIRQMHGDLYGVGWDRAQGKAESAIARY